MRKDLGLVQSLGLREAKGTESQGSAPACTASLPEILHPDQLQHRTQNQARQESRGAQKGRSGDTDIRTSVRRLGLIHIQGLVLLQVTSVLGNDPEGWGCMAAFSPAPSPGPSPTETPSTKVFTSNLGPASSLPATTWPSMTRQDTPDHSQHPRSLLSDVHFLLLVFLELPLLLSMLSAVLWVNRPQKSSGRRGNQADYENQ
ncbi:uncharacterized protein LOC141568911 isoform X2 [Rhinolophus sinicus]|uniref:uncharacterized protein LOC141568911 isoform X2 n=1 Tax=Rhinolophus sinicus TaxID=89399 RepID=UPI003D7A6446